MKSKGLGIYFVIMAGLVVLMLWSTRNSSGTSGYTYPTFLSDLEAGEVSSVTVRQNGNGETPTGELDIALKDGTKKTLYVPDVKDAIKDMNEQDMSNYFVTDVQRDSFFLTAILPVLLGVVVIIVFFTFMNNQASGGGNSKVMNFGKSRAKMVIDTAKKVTFKIVAQSLGNEFLNIIQLLRRVQYVEDFWDVLMK